MVTYLLVYFLYHPHISHRCACIGRSPHRAHLFMVHLFIIGRLTGDLSNADRTFRRGLTLLYQFWLLEGISEFTSYAVSFFKTSMYSVAQVRRIMTIRMPFRSNIHSGIKIYILKVHAFILDLPLRTVYSPGIPFNRSSGPPTCSTARAARVR